MTSTSSWTMAYRAAALEPNNAPIGKADRRSTKSNDGAMA